MQCSAVGGLYLGRCNPFIPTAACVALADESQSRAGGPWGGSCDTGRREGGAVRTVLTFCLLSASNWMRPPARKACMRTMEVRICSSVTQLG